MKRAHVTIGALVVAACLTVSACGSGSSSSGNKGKAGGKVVGCPTADPAGAKSEADRSAILKYGDMPAQSLDPIRQVGGSEIAVVKTIYDALVKLDENNKPHPGLATSWKMINDNTMQFKLRSGVKFQDGTTFDGEAVKFNIERAKNDASSTIKADLTSIKNVKVVDAQTVNFELDPPNPGALPITMGGRGGMMASPTAVKQAGSSEAFSLHPVGAGPYKVEGTWHPVESISVRAWDGYWNAENRLLGGIDFRQLSFDASVPGLKAGDLDIQVVETSDVATLCGDSNMRVAITPTNQLRVFVLNMAWKPFNDLKVRQALAYALDREAIAKLMTNDLSDAAYQFFPEGQSGYNKDLDNLYAYDPDKAKKLLEEAGYSDSNPLSFRCEIGTGSTSYQRMGEIIQSELAKIGVKEDLQLVDRNALVPRLFGTGGRQIEVGCSPLAFAGANQPSERFTKYLYKDGLLNPAKIEPEGMRALVEKADATTDASERDRLFGEAVAIAVKELEGGVPLYFVPGVTGFASYVGGVDVGATRDNIDFDGVYITKGKKSVGERK